MLETRGENWNYNYIKNGQNIEKSPGELRRLAVIQAPVKDHQLKLIWNLNNNNLFISCLNQLIKARRHISRNIVEITIKMQTVVQKNINDKKNPLPSQVTTMIFNDFLSGMMKTFDVACNFLVVKHIFVFDGSFNARVLVVFLVSPIALLMDMLWFTGILVDPRRRKNIV